MPRQWVTVRPVQTGDWPAVHGLWGAIAREMPVGIDTLSRHLSLERLRSTLECPGISTLVAVHDDAVVGVVVLTSSPLTKLTNDASMTVEALYVLPEHRGRGVAGQLLARAAIIAESLGAQNLASTAPAASRSANRFYARLGFNAAVTRRVVSASALRRRLAVDTPSVDRVVARRRSLRARASAARDRGVDALTVPDVPGRHAL